MYCQKCRAPLKLDGSLEDLNPAAFDLLVGASSQQQPKNIPPSRPGYPQERKQLYDRVSKGSSSPTFRRNISGSRRSDASSIESRTGLTNPAMSFVMLTESQVVPASVVKSPEDTNPKRRGPEDIVNMDGTDDEKKAMSQEMERVSRLFEILSARSDIDHPVCVECTDLLVEGLQQRLNAATKERDAYSGFLKQVNADVPTEDEVKEALEQLAQAKADEATAIEELKQLEKDKAEVEKEIAELDKEALALDIEEEKFWRERNAFAINLDDYQNLRDSVNQQYDHDSQLLEKLQRTNVYNDTFCISHDGNFGTINGLRLGRLSNVTVDWPEINAAWGHTVLLLATVAEKLGFKFHNYELQPMGSTSRIIRYDHPSPSTSRAGSQRSSTTRVPTRKVLELYSSGDMPLGLTFMHRKFDTAMVAFLACVKQLGEFVEKESMKGGNEPLRLPYKIDGDRIYKNDTDTMDSVSIKLGIAQDDSWSRACKYTLTCCKFLLAHTSNTARNTRKK